MDPYIGINPDVKLI